MQFVLFPFQSSYSVKKKTLTALRLSSFFSSIELLLIFIWWVLTTYIPHHPRPGHHWIPSGFHTAKELKLKLKLKEGSIQLFHCRATNERIQVQKESRVVLEDSKDSIWLVWFILLLWNFSSLKRWCFIRIGVRGGFQCSGTYILWKSCINSLPSFVRKDSLSWMVEWTHHPLFRLLRMENSTEIENIADNNKKNWKCIWIWENGGR